MATMVVDPNRPHPDLGSEEDFEHLLEELQRAGMEWIQDIVPHHMAFDYQNEMLMDVLENGRRSEYYDFFDIDWDHAYGNIKAAPRALLGRFYGQSLVDGEITLHYGREGLTVHYYELVFPVRIDSYPSFFSHGLSSLKKKLGEDHRIFIKVLGRSLRFADHLFGRAGRRPFRPSHVREEDAVGPVCQQC